MDLFIFFMIHCRPFRPSDLEKSAQLICDTFKRFNSKEGSPEAVQRYLDQYNSKKRSRNELLATFSRTPFIYVATDRLQVIGIVRARDNRVVNFFVHGDYHGQGIGRKLAEVYESWARSQGSAFIRVRASLYAIAFYQHMGYKKTTGIRMFHGLKFQPMIKRL